MKTLIAICAAALLYLAAPSRTALACEGCVLAEETMPTQVACLQSPDGPGEICTAGGGYCYEEGKCKVQITGDGSLPTVELRGQLAVEASRSDTAVRRACDAGVVARSYAPATAARLREQARAITI